MRDEEHGPDKLRQPHYPAYYVRLHLPARSHAQCPAGSQCVSIKYMRVPQSFQLCHPTVIMCSTVPCVRA
jgi:hypothetical protein